MNNKNFTGSPLYIVLIILGIAVFAAFSITAGLAIADIDAQKQSAIKDAELDEFKLALFNNQFKALDGKQLAPKTRQMLERVAEHNETAEDDRLITVTFLGETSDDPVIIASLIKKVDNSKVYFLTLDYNEEGLVSSVLIGEIKS